MGMDIDRPDLLRKTKNRRLAFSLTALLLLSLITISLGRLKPVSPSTESASLFVDTVKRGELLRSVRGNGLLASCGRADCEFRLNELRNDHKLLSELHEEGATICMVTHIGLPSEPIGKWPYSMAV